MINDTLQSVKEFGNGVAAVPFTETGIISEDKEYTEKTIIRNTLYVNAQKHHSNLGSYETGHASEAVVRYLTDICNS